jgi:cytoskeleton protein RodZ
MSEVVKSSADLVPDAGGPTAGALLRRAREASGLHIAALAVAMKVPVKKLEALEADRLADLPDAVFVRALAGSMCRALKIDPAPILSRLPQSAMPRLDRDERGINTPFDAPSMQYGNSVLSFISRPAALWVIGLLMAALLVVYFPEVHTASQAVIAPSTADSSPPNIPEATHAVTSLTATSAAEVAVAPVSSPVMVAPAPAPVNAASEAVTVAKNAVMATEPAQLPGSSGDLLVFKAKSTAWVRVSDSKGAVQFEKTLAAGETATASGVLPLAIVVGNVAATEMLVRGQAFNLEEVAKNNVARFEVK